jgi:hypothetical protein
MLETPDGLAIPRVLHVPNGKRPGHLEAVRLAAEGGLILDPVQEFCLAVAMAEDDSGMWAADLFDYLVSRQNGKNEGAIVREVFGLAVLGETIVHSAHHFGTTKKSFKRLWTLIQKIPDVASMVTDYHHSATAGHNITLRNGGTVEFIARGSAGAGRGFDAIDLLVLDEAQELKDDMLGDVMPVVSAVENHQIWQFGTAPDESQFFWQRKRHRGRRGLDVRTAYVEVSADPDADHDDVEQWRQANPALLYGRMTEDTIRGERGNMSDETFARERLSISPEILDTGVLPGWEDICQPDLEVAATAFALDCDPERTHGSIVAGNPTELEVVEYRPGVGWLIGRAEELHNQYRKPFAIDRTGPAATLVPELERRKVAIIDVPGADMPRACGHLYDSVVNGTVKVRTNRDLNMAVEMAAVRTVGDAWAWRRKTSKADISLLVAATLAHWAAQEAGKVPHFYA